MKRGWMGFRTKKRKDNTERERKLERKKEKKKREGENLAGLGTHAESRLNGLAALNGGPEDERAGSSFPTQEGSDSEKGCPK